MLEVFEGLEAVGLGRFDQAECRSAGLGTVGCIAEQEVLTRDHVRLDGSLGRVIGNLQTAVQEEVVQCFPLGQAVFGGPS